MGSKLKKGMSSFFGKSKSYIKIISFLVPTLGLIAAVVLVQQNQDMRNKAAGTQCSDDIDNDGDGKYDFDGYTKRVCTGSIRNETRTCQRITYSPDPDCTSLEDNSEAQLDSQKVRILSFNDEFDGNTLDHSKWGVTYRMGHRTVGDKDRQWYINDAHIVSNGTLKLVTKYETINSSNPSWKPDYDPVKFPYTSGMINSFVIADSPYLVNHYFPYGYFEARIKVPTKPGTWPAFWLMPAPVVPDLPGAWPPEIDIMEMHTIDTRTNEMGRHINCNYPLMGGGHCGIVGSRYTLPADVQGDFSSDFHIFAVDWQPGLLVWYIDGVERFRTTDRVPVVTLDDPNGMAGMFIKVTMEMGINYEVPNPADFPQQLEIDYIRYFQNVPNEPLQIRIEPNETTGVGSWTLYASTSSGPYTGYLETKACISESSCTPGAPIKWGYGDGTYFWMENGKQVVNMNNVVNKVYGLRHVWFRPWSEPILGSNNLPWSNEAVFRVNDSNPSTSTPTSCGANASYVNGSCQCLSSWGNCNSNWSDGCETGLTTKSNCGACGRTCGRNERCLRGQCVYYDPYM